MKFAFAFGLALAASAYAAPVSEPVGKTVPKVVAPVSGVAPVSDVKLESVPAVNVVKAVEPAPKPVPVVEKAVPATVVDVRSAVAAPVSLNKTPVESVDAQVKKVSVVADAKPVSVDGGKAAPVVGDVKPVAAVRAPVQDSAKPLAVKQTKPAVVFPAVPINTRPIGAQPVNSVPAPSAVEASVGEVLQKPVEAVKPVPATVAAGEAKPADESTLVVVEKVVAQPLPVVSVAEPVVAVIDARNVVPQKPVFVGDVKPAIQGQAAVVQGQSQVVPVQVPVVQEQASALKPSAVQVPVVQGQAPVQTQFPSPVIEKATVPLAQVPVAQPVQQAQPVGAQFADNIIVPVQVAKPLFSRQDINVPVGQSVPVAGLPQFVPIF